MFKDTPHLVPFLPSLVGPLCEQLWTQTRILMGNGSYKQTPPTMQEPTPGVVGPGVCSPRARWELGSRLRGALLRCWHRPHVRQGICLACDSDMSRH